MIKFIKRLLCRHKDISLYTHNYQDGSTTFKCDRCSKMIIEK